jgi:hypothetical protein
MAAMNQSNTNTEEQQKHETLFVKFPEEIAIMLKDLQLQVRNGDQLFLRGSSEKIGELRTKFEEHEFTVVPREKNIKLHVSCKDKEVFDKVFPADTVFEFRLNDADKFIATVTCKNEEEYATYLEMGNDRSNGCLIKQYNQRYIHNNHNHESQYTRQAQQNNDNGKGNGKGKGKGYGKSYGKGNGKGFIKNKDNTNDI